MRFDRLTEKASEAIVEAQNEAREYKHASIDPEHLLLALLRQQGGVVPAVIDRMGGDRDSLFLSGALLGLTAFSQLNDPAAPAASRPPLISAP